MNRFFLFTALLFLTATAVLLWATQGEKINDATPAGISGEEITAAPASETIPIGGAFSLIDQEKKPRSDADFRGRLMLVFFGFTHCPDVCPVSVATLSSLMELLGDKAGQVAPIFITVDPARDTPEVMKAYLANFDKRITGLTGSADDIKKITDAYKAYYSPAKSEEAHEHMDHGKGPAAPAEDNYQVDHSGYIYLMDREGKYLQHFSYNVSEQELADALKPHLQ